MEQKSLAGYFINFSSRISLLIKTVPSIVPRLARNIPKTEAHEQRVSNNLIDARVPLRTEVNKKTKMNFIRSWSKKYDTLEDPIEFISRTEKLVMAYGIESNHTAGSMVVLLRGCALDWWHTHPTPMPTWESFKKEFVEYHRPLDHEE